MTQVRTRIAPSPTGDPHVGTAYIALFNLCFARQHGGKFILRIEDTDQTRSTAESERQIIDTLRWLQLDWDEGPDKGGDYGPYRQSQRSAIYEEHVQKLLEDGNAFHCFCSAERLESLRKEQMASKKTLGYDGHCLHLSQASVEEKLASGETHVVRMRVPREGKCLIKDMLRDDVEIDWQQVDMQVLMKSDGLPTYHLANVVDDHLMAISHVIRGEEWISSAPKHLLLYQYFGWEPPVLCHMPLLRNADKSKLSKRKNPTSIGYYQAMGYLPDALLNYLGMMGWSMPDEREKFALQEMIEHFDINRVSLGGPVFDVEKLDWLNGRYLREELSEGELIQRYSEWAFQPEKIAAIVPLIRQRVEKFSDVMPLAGFFFSALPDISEASFEHKKLSVDQCTQILQFTVWRLDSIQHWDRDNIEAVLMALADSLDLKIRDVVFPLFIAIAGTARSCSVIDSIAVLGRDLSRARLRHGIEVLGGISKKEAKRLEKAFAELESASGVPETKD